MTHRLREDPASDGVELVNYSLPTTTSIRETDDQSDVVQLNCDWEAMNMLVSYLQCISSSQPHSTLKKTLANSIGASLEWARYCGTIPQDSFPFDSLPLLRSEYAQLLERMHRQDLIHSTDWIAPNPIQNPYDLVQNFFNHIPFERNDMDVGGDGDGGYGEDEFRQVTTLDGDKIMVNFTNLSIVRKAVLLPIYYQVHAHSWSDSLDHVSAQLDYGDGRQKQLLAIITHDQEQCEMHFAARGRSNYWEPTHHNSLGRRLVDVEDSFGNKRDIAVVLYYDS